MEAKPFWDQILTHIENGDIAILDLVKEELQNGNEDDQLKLWIELANIGNFIDRREPDILNEYAAVLQYIQECGYYNDTALNRWAQRTIVDPWLIAAAKAKRMVLVTQETNFHRLDIKNQTKNIRIPDVAKAFNVEIMTLFDMMCELGIHL